MTDVFKPFIAYVFRRVFEGGCLMTVLFSASSAHALAVANDVSQLKPAGAPIELLKGREIGETRGKITVEALGETVSIDALGELSLADREAVEDAFHPTISLTVLADSGLPAGFFEELAAETQLLKTLPVRILFKGLPMMTLPDGRVTADRVEAAKRLSPLLEAGIPSAVDPRVFREVRAALDMFEEKTSTGPMTVTQPFTAPSVLVSVDGPDAAEPRRELVVGTLSPVKALREVALHSPYRLMRRDLRDGLEDLGLSHVIDLSAHEAPDCRPAKAVSETKATVLETAGVFEP